MVDKAKSEVTRTLVLSGLDRLGYRGPLLARNYVFSDYFSHAPVEREAAAVAFGQTPVSYDSACIGVVESDGVSGAERIDEFRSLGAPLILEVDGEEIREWGVSRIPGRHALLGTYDANNLNNLFIERATDWQPPEFLRSKNIGIFRWEPQLSLFSGLIPELEDEIQEKLDPLLRDTLSATKRAYRESTGKDADPSQLFRLIFSLLTAKVFRDRQVLGFEEFGLEHSADEMLAKLASHYHTKPITPLNRDARQVAVSRIWGRLDFRNLSVEVLSQIWSSLLVDPATRDRLGIHRTSRTIVRHIVDRIPFSQTGDDHRIVFEPCSGSSVFLVGAMNALRHSLYGMRPEERHEYFVNHFAGIEKELFGVEISKLALTLADFPNPGGWDVRQGDVFNPDDLRPYVQRSGVVLCNPPFRDFKPEEKRDYAARSSRQPEELLNRILDDLPPEGVLGFVLPRIAVRGAGYADIRRRLAERFASIDLTILPDRAFDQADVEVALLVATEPLPHKTSRIVNLKIDDSEDAWRAFAHSQPYDSAYETLKTPEEAEESLAIPDLPDTWEFLRTNPTLSDILDQRGRGIRWNHPMKSGKNETGFREIVVRDKPAEGFRLGIPPKAKFCQFEKPPLKYLDFRQRHRQFGAFTLPWDKPKVVVNKTTKSRGRWRIAAIPDTEGLACYQTHLALWPKADSIDAFVLAAILNGPVANAFVSTRAGKTDITIELLDRVPMPYLTDSQTREIHVLVRRYQKATNGPLIRDDDAAALLLDIDAAVLGGYRLPPKIEHKLLEWFRGQDRPVAHVQSEYFPKGSEVYFSLAERRSPDFGLSTAGELLKRLTVG